MLKKHFKIQKSPETIDARLANFLFGAAKGYDWGERSRLEEYFYETVKHAGGFIQFGTEKRILYHKLVPFTVFKTEQYEFAFNRLIWDDEHNFINQQSNAHVFLFHNNQRVMTIQLEKPSLAQRLTDNKNHEVKDHMIHWSINNQWISNYFDFMQRIERTQKVIEQSKISAPSIYLTQNFAYRLGYFIGETTLKLRRLFKPRQ